MLISVRLRSCRLPASTRSCTSQSSFAPTMSSHVLDRSSRKGFLLSRWKLGEVRGRRSKGC
eukprot:751654-Hanusia_phi.AAC.2